MTTPPDEPIEEIHIEELPEVVELGTSQRPSGNHPYERQGRIFNSGRRWYEGY